MLTSPPLPVPSASTSPRALRPAPRSAAQMEPLPSTVVLRNPRYCLKLSGLQPGIIFHLRCFVFSGSGPCSEVTERSRTDRELTLKTWQPSSAPYRCDTRSRSGTCVPAAPAGRAKGRLCPPPGAGPAGDALPRGRPAPCAASRARGTGQPTAALGPGRAQGGSLPATRGPVGQGPGRWHGRHTRQQPARNQAQ